MKTNTVTSLQKVDFYILYKQTQTHVNTHTPNAPWYKDHKDHHIIFTTGGVILNYTEILENQLVAICYFGTGQIRGILCKDGNDKE